MIIHAISKHTNRMWVSVKYLNTTNKRSNILYIDNPFYDRPKGWEFSEWGLVAYSEPSTQLVFIFYQRRKDEKYNLPQRNLNLGRNAPKI